MKKRIFCSVLVFMFTWVAIGALDCGCAYAGSAEMPPNKVSKAAETADCHGAETPESKKEDVCCAGCKLENKAPVPPNVQVANPTGSKLADVSVSMSQSGALGVVSLLNTSRLNRGIANLRAKHAHGVSFYDTPIYLAIQSFLI